MLLTFFLDQTNERHVGVRQKRAVEPEKEDKKSMGRMMQIYRMIDAIFIQND